MGATTRREFIKGATALTAGMALSRASGLRAEEDDGRRRPNLVFVFPDQFRRQSMGFMGEDPVVTPNLDRLASEGLVLTQAVSNYPVCSPYRAMLMTGQYPTSNGVLANCQSRRTRFGNYLKASARCLSDVLHDAGYSLGYIGKWHLDGPPSTEKGEKIEWDAYTPPERRHGFDFWYSYGVFNDHMNPHYWVGGAAEDARTEVHDWSPRHEANVAMDYIRNRDGRHRSPDQPFALFVSMNPPHSPYHLVPDEYVAMYDEKTSGDLLNRPNVDFDLENGRKASRSVKHYFASVTGVDDQFGRILRCLEEEGLEEETVVVFSADHGDMMGSHDRMDKNVWYEESCGMPFLIRWTGQIRPGTDDLLLSAPDVMPSLLGLMGLSDRTPEAVEGTDYSVAMLGGTVARPTSALYFLIPTGRPGGGRRGLRTHRYTFVIQKRTRQNQVVLHDNVEDPYQMKNIAGEAPEVVRALTEELHGWLRKTDDPWLEA